MEWSIEDRRRVTCGVCLTKGRPALPSGLVSHGWVQCPKCSWHVRRCNEHGGFKGALIAWGEHKDACAWCLDASDPWRERFGEHGWLDWPSESKGVTT